MKNIKYECFVDSIQIRYNNLRLEELFKDIFGSPYIHNNSLVYTYSDKKTILFSVRTIQDSLGINYQLISFNGFKKYCTRDLILASIFNEMIQLLNDNDIHFFINKIDTAIDFYDIELEQLDIERKKSQGVRRQLLKEQDKSTIDKIKSNEITFYYEKQTKKKNQTEQRAYLYNKSIKENIEDKTIYRFEVEMRKFNSIEKYSIEEYKEHLLDAVKNRFHKYIVKCDNINIDFDYTLVEQVIDKCNRF